MPAIKPEAPAASVSFFESRAAEYALVALSGGVLYYSLEILWRGWSHFSMAVCGAVCLLLFYHMEKSRHFRALRLPFRAVLGGLIITAVELTAGLILNRHLGLSIWDYSGEKLDLWGQICLRMSLLWCLLSAAAFPLCDLIRRRIFGIF